MIVKPRDRRALTEAALGKRPCDLVIKNARIVNVFTGEIYNGNVGIYDGFIAHIQCDPDNLNISEKELQSEYSYDAKGKYLIPGFIDAHAHVESTMMTPRHLAEAVIPHGTTTMVTDPHEIANVCGTEGVRYMHENSSNLPMRQLILIPSCVPAVPGLENSGAVFLEKEVRELLDLDRVIGLAEVMDFLGVINNDERMISIIKAVEERNLFLEGHAPFLSGRELSAYLCAGPNSDHECTVSQEAREKMRSGMYIDARESSITKNVKTILDGVKNFRYFDTLTLCTDDREPEDILSVGHMNDVVRKAVSCGLHPIDAVKCSTINVAREIGAKNLGAIAPGYAADMVLTESLEELVPSAVFFGGKLVAEEGRLTAVIENMEFMLEKENTIYIDDLKVEDFKIKTPCSASDGKVKARVICYKDFNSSETDIQIEELPVKDGYVDLSNSELKYAVVINRHKGFDTKGYGIVRNFGTHFGAVGSTVSHDSHNLTIVYDNPENAFEVARSIMEGGGGISCAKDGKVLETLALPIGGLMSHKSCSLLAEDADRMKRALRTLGLTQKENPLLRIATLALPVIPKVKMSDLGMVDVLEQKILEMFVL
ncbi:MAG: adenine deaminase [Sedimentibacter sp.]|uniref:adenine deaminase n=1 Tax=Sedimentibacter sp. TaxID=1960295 RepID=UPI003158B80B